MKPPDMDLMGFSELLLVVYQTGDAKKVMAFLREHERTLWFHHLLAKTTREMVKEKESG